MNIGEWWKEKETTQIYLKNYKKFSNTHYPPLHRLVVAKSFHVYDLPQPNADSNSTYHILSFGIPIYTL